MLYSNFLNIILNETKEDNTETKEDNAANVTGMKQKLSLSVKFSWANKVNKQFLINFLSSTEHKCQISSTVSSLNNNKSLEKKCFWDIKNYKKVTKTM